MSARLGHLRHLALKGPHAIAQGEALGWAAKHKMSPERAKYGSVQWTNLASRKPSQAMPPFQGGNRVGFGFPGRSPGLSHLAPSGPGDGRALPPNRHPARKRGTHTAAGECRGRPLVLSPHGYGSRAFARDDDCAGGSRAFAGVTVTVRRDASASQPNPRHPARKRGTHSAAGQYRGWTLVSSQHGYGSRAFARDDDRGGARDDAHSGGTT